MRKRTFLAGTILALWSMTGVPAASAADQLQLIINDQLYLQTAQQAGPQLVGERVYVPLRLVGQSLGYQVAWSETERRVYISTATAAVPIAESGTAAAETEPISIAVDGVVLAADEKTGLPFIAETGQTMVPLRLVGEALHCEVVWQDGVVIVTEPAPAAAVAEPENTASAEDPYRTLTIQGASVATAEQLNAYLEEKEADIRAMMERNYPEKGFTPFPENIAQLYLEIGKKYNIRGDLAFAQALKETGYFQFYGSVQAFQNNFCGLGASGVENTGEEALNGVDETRVVSIPGLHGLTFLTVADGVEAHIQHLYAYATDDPLPDGCELLDPRFGYVKRGVAEKWVDLDGRWAIPGDGYGESIINDYWLPAVE